MTTMDGNYEIVSKTLIFRDKESNEYIEIFMHNDGHVGIILRDGDTATVYHYMIKKNVFFPHVADAIYDVVFGAADIATAKDALEEFLNDGVYEYLEDYPEWEPEMRSEEEICEYMSEAHDRVWLVRKQNLFFNLLFGEESINANILDGCNKAIDEVCSKYDIDFKESVSDWDYGYWSGILAALRWVMGEEKDILDT